MKIKGKLLALIVTAVLLVGSIPLGAFAAAVGENAMTTEAKNIYDTFKSNFVKSEARENDGYIGIPVHLYIYTDGKETKSQPRDVIFYVINHGSERIGRESDTSIVGSYIQEGYVVIVVDYLKNARAVSPDIEHSLAELRNYYMVKNTGFSGTNIAVRKNYAYFLPAGYRLARDIVYWEQDIHASYGTLNYVVKVWNEYIAGKSKYKVNGQTPKTAQTIDDCTKPDGSPLDFRLRMDIVYPSDPTKETPVYAMAATQAEMHMHTCEPTSCHFVGFTFNGYTAITFDYVYVPMARADHFGYIDAYGTHSYNAAKMARAAIRCIRYYAEKFGYNDELIGVGGISKGTPPPSFLSIIGNKDVPEINNFASDPNGDRFEGDVLDANGNVIRTAEQPFLTYEGGYDGNTAYYGTDPERTGEISSEITVAYCAAGDGANWMYGKTSGYDRVPMVLSCGKLDQYGCWGHWDNIVEHFVNNAVNPFLAMGMEEQGHVYPTGYDTVLGYDRYPQLLNFFDCYLKPESYTPSVVWMTPVAGADPVPVDASIEVKFITPMDPTSLADGLTISDTAGNKLVGEWVASELNSRFVFKHSGLKAGTVYTVKATAALRDEDGKAYTERFERTFVTEGFKGLTAIADAYVSSAEPDRVFGGADTLSLLTNGDEEHLLFLSFSSDGLATAKKAALRIPAQGLEYQTVSVYVINGYTVDENTLCYSNMPVFDKLYLGDYTLSPDGALLDLDLLPMLITKPTFTLVLRPVVTDAYSYYQDFEDITGSPARDTSTFNKCWSEKGVISVGGSPSGYTTVSVKDGNGNDTRALLITATHGYDRIKFFNTISDDELTDADLDRSIRVAFRVMTDHDGKISYGMMSANGGSRVSGYSGPASTYNQSMYQGKTVNTKAGQWLDVVAYFTVDATMIQTQTGMFAVQTDSANSTNNKFYIDNISVGDVIPSSTVAAREQADQQQITLLLGDADTFSNLQVSVIPETPDLPAEPEETESETETEPSETDAQQTEPQESDAQETDAQETDPSNEETDDGAGDQTDGGNKGSVVLPIVIGAIAAVAVAVVGVFTFKRKKK